MKRCIKFTKQLAKNVFHMIKHDCMRFTGYNLRKMQYYSKSRIGEPIEVEKMYHPILNNELCQIICMR